jgi:hypothetical protein
MFPQSCLDPTLGIDTDEIAQLDHGDPTVAPAFPGIRTIEIDVEASLMPPGLYPPMFPRGE